MRGHRIGFRPSHTVRCRPGNPQRTYPTFSLALAALPEAHWSALTPAAPLRRWRLIEVGSGDTLTTSQLRIDERVLHYFAGITCLDARLQGLVELLPPPSDLPPSQRELAQRIADFVSRSREASAWPVDQSLRRLSPLGNTRLPPSPAPRWALQVHVLRAADMPLAVAEREALARLWEREAALSGSALLLDYDEPENNRAALSFIENVHSMLLVASREPLRLWKRPSLRFDVNKPSTTEQRTLWQEALGPVAPRLNGHLKRWYHSSDSAHRPSARLCRGVGKSSSLSGWF